MKLLFLLISINLVFIVIGDPEVKHFYIENNKNKCALLDLSSDIDVIYLTKYGLNSTNLKMSQAPEDQSGMCDNGTNAVFNISINPNLNAFLNFNFINSNQLVSLSSIQFGYMLSNNSYFPGATESGYVSITSNTSISLSKATNFYQCKSNVKIHLSENVTLNFYFAKLKVFNVVNNSFGDGMDECQEDFNLTTIFTSQTTSSSSTSEAKTTESTVTTSTHLTTKPTLSTSAISTSHISTSHIPTSHTSISPSTSSAYTTSLSSAETSSLTKSSSSSSTHLSSISTKVTTSIPVSTTMNPKKTFLYAVQANKEFCLLIESLIDAKIFYKVSNKKTESKIFYFSNSSFIGDCLPNINTITITSVPDVNLTMIFSKKDTNSILTQVQLIYLLSNQTFPGYVGPNISVNETMSINECKVDTSKGYECKSVNITLKTSIVEFKSFHYEAFRTDKNVNFKTDKTDCEAVVANSIVAIVVGVVLAVFLVIIVVVFLILRYRANKTKGYEEI